MPRGIPKKDNPDAYADRKVKRDREEESPQREPVEARGDGKIDAMRVSDEELESILRADALDNILPSPPPIPGFHICWLSTTNQYTPISWYERLGYRPVKKQELSGWRQLKEHSSDTDDSVRCNEMILYKVTMVAYQQIMKRFHHDIPNEEASKLNDKINALTQGDEFKDSDGKSLVKSVAEDGQDGFRDILKNKNRPGHFEG